MTDVYERNINIAVARANEHEIVTKATLLDLNHHIRVELVVDLPSETITDARAQMTKVPYSVCQLALDNIRRIIGLRIQRGIHKQLADRLGHADGCTHMVDLAVEAVKLSANVIIGLNKVGPDWFNPEGIPEHEMIDRVKSILRNTCLPFKDEQ